MRIILILAFASLASNFGAAQQKSPWQVTAPGADFSLSFERDGGRNAVMQATALVAFKAPFIYVRRPWEGELPTSIRFRFKNENERGNGSVLHVFCLGDSVWEPLFGKFFPMQYHGAPLLGLSQGRGEGWTTIEMKFQEEYFKKSVHELVIWLEFRPEQTNESFFIQIDDIFFVYRSPGLSGQVDSVLVDDMESYLPTEVDRSFSTTLPSGFSLAQNYPNPFNPTTTIAFTLPQSGEVSLTVFDLLGQEVATVVNGRLQAGNHVVSFYAPTNLPSGIYHYVLQVGEHRQVRRMLLVR